jgi:hypothetical protein
VVTKKAQYINCLRGNQTFRLKKNEAHSKAGIERDPGAEIGACAGISKQPCGDRGKPIGTGP